MVFNAFSKIVSSYQDTKKYLEVNLKTVFFSAVHSVAFSLVCSLHGEGGRIKSIF